MTTRILIADDDPHIRDVIAYALETAGYQTEAVGDGRAALDAVHLGFGLLILDIGMPEMDGLAVCREIRKTSDLPILFLTARDDEVDRILGFELGGDDYVTKPFSPREVVSRVRAILKRIEMRKPSEDDGPMSFGNLHLDRGRHVCTFAGEQVSLTASEFGLLATLMRRPEQVLSRPQLTDALYGANIHVSDRTIDSHIRNLRKKLSDAGAPEAIETIHGVGLRMGECSGR